MRGSSAQDVILNERFAARMALSYLENGELSQDLCIGKSAHCSIKDDVRSISGTFAARMHETAELSCACQHRLSKRVRLRTLPRLR